MSDTPPKVSVIIPTFNRATLLPRAIASVQAQTMSDWELIIVDDASTDETEQLIRSCLSQDPRIKYVRHENNRGVAAARNTGISQASGKFISFLDSDDEWRSAKLAVQIDFLQSHPELAGCLTGILWKNGGRAYATSPPSIEPQKMAEEIVSRRLTAFGSGSCLAVRTEFIQQNGIRYEEQWRAFEDWDFTAQIARGGGLGVVEQVLVTVYRQNDGSTHGWTPQNVIETAPLLLNKYADEYRTRSATRARIHSLVAINHEMLGDYHRARGHWRRAWRCRPRQLGFIRRFLLASIRSMRDR